MIQTIVVLLTNILSTEVIIIILIQKFESQDEK